MEIIELFGVPGSGKTKATLEMYRTFEESGKKCILLRENEYEKLPVLNRKKYMYRVFKFKNLGILFKLLFDNLFYRGVEYNNGNIKGRLKILLRQIMYLEIYSDIELKNNYDVLISDQGVIQELSGYLLENEKLCSWLDFFLKKIRKIKTGVKFVYLSQPINQVKVNISKRNRKTAEMDFFDESTLNKYLTDYNRILENIYVKNSDKNDFIKLNKLLNGGVS